MTAVSKSEDTVRAFISDKIQNCERCCNDGEDQANDEYDESCTCYSDTEKAWELGSPAAEPAIFGVELRVTNVVDRIAIADRPQWRTG